MIWLIRRLRRDFFYWDRYTRAAFVIGVALLIGALIAGLLAPPQARLLPLAGAGGLLIVLEITILWGNRGMVSAFTQAQRYYLAGNFDAALDILESIHDKADARVLTLLGNTYRQLGRLDESETVLSEALDKVPDHHYPLYGFGRTLLAKGRYAEAAEAIRRAQEAGAPPVVLADLGEAYYRLERWDEAAAALHAAEGEEPHRALMVQYLLYRLGEASPPSSELVAAGLPYWQASAQRFQQTPYGVALTRDVQELLELGA